MMDKLTAAVLAGFTIVGLSMEASASSSASAAYGQCKAEVQEKFGENTRIALRGSKRFSGTVTVKLSIVPEGESRQRLQCKINGDALVLMDRKGQPIS